MFKMIHSTKEIIFICAMFSVISFGFSAKILGIFPFPSRSHRNLYTPLVKELLERGHNVTIISPFKEDFSSENSFFTNITVEGLEKWTQDTMKQTYKTTNSNVLRTIRLYTGVSLHITEMTLANENVQNVIKSGEKFDAVIIFHSMNYAHGALAAHFAGPFILFSSMGASLWFNELTRNPAPPACIPDIFSGYYAKMSFFERIRNSAIYFYTKVYLHWFLFPKHDQLIKKYIPGGATTDQVLYNISLVLLNSHPGINQAVPYLPNMVDIGGLHVKPFKQLPRNLQDYLDSAEDGFIYFSMGSILKSTGMPNDKREVLLKTFSKLKQKVLWKWEDDMMSGQPPNVKVGKWLPQQDILAHPNIKLFITHGGLLSITESVYNGVPVLVIPIFGDQILNAKIAVSLGFGLSVPFDKVSEEMLTHTIDQLLNNPKYTEIARFRSKIFRSSRQRPLEVAASRIENTIRRRGTPHEQVSSLKVSFFEYLLLDIVILFTIAFSVILFALYTLCKVIRYRKHFYVQ